MGARQLLVEDGWIGIRPFQMSTCALGLDNSASSALELDHSILITCAHELDHSRIGKMNDIHWS